MRILVLGAGGIGGYYGGRLAEAGADVTFLVRPGRAAQLARDGLVVKSALGDITRAVRFVTGDGLADDAHFDLVLLTCKAYDLDAALAAIAPAVQHGAAVLPMLNGMQHLDRLDLAFGRPAVLGGMCQIAATLTGTGEVLHLNKLHHMVAGSREPGQDARAQAFAQLAEQARFDFRLSEDIAAGHVGKIRLARNHGIHDLPDARQRRRYHAGRRRRGADARYARGVRPGGTRRRAPAASDLHDTRPHDPDRARLDLRRLNAA